LPRLKRFKMNLTKRQKENILFNNLINTCTEEEKKQVFTYAFGEEFMQSNNKGTLKTY